MKTKTAWIAKLSGLLWVMGSLAALPAFAAEQPTHTCQRHEKPEQTQAQTDAGAQAPGPAIGFAQFPRGAR